jgi:hypothetical protein
MTKTAIPRMSIADGDGVKRYFEGGPASPCILIDAIADWSARSDWTLEYFAREFGAEFGVAKRDFFGAGAGRASTLADFIGGFSRPLRETAGFWIGDDGVPEGAATTDDDAPVWSFLWQPFKRHPHLLDAVSPFPGAIPNMVTSLPDDLYAALQTLSGFEFHSLYISRGGTVTPLHGDHSHSIGCLVQFAGTKHVTMYAPDDHVEINDQAFDPERPDYARYPEMHGKTAHLATLQPGDMLIIPPDWWHHTRAIEPSITLSHNFFTPHTFAGYFTSQLLQLAHSPHRDRTLSRVGRHLAATAHAGTT